MLKALAARTPRGCAWVWLSIVLVGGLPASAPSQTSGKLAAEPRKKGGASKGVAKDRAARKGTTKGNEPEAATPEEAPKKSPSFEIFKDRNAEKCLANTFKQFPGGPLRESDIRIIKSMVTGGATIERDQIQRFVSAAVSDLTSHTNIKALIDPGLKVPVATARAIERATNSLLDPLLTARAQSNTGFLTVYNDVLLKTLPSLLDNHLIPRIEAMIVLGQVGTPEAVDIYVKQLSDKNQTVWVKLWAARGLDNATKHGQRELEVGRAVGAARALAGFLEQEKEIPWPAQLRALEALGSLRQAAVPSALSKAEMASTVMRYLADPEARLEVRSEAAWAMGMMQSTSTITRFNFPLVVHNVGQIAADLGEVVGTTFRANPAQSDHWSSLLLFQLYPALTGEPGIPNTGLLTASNGTQAHGFVKQVADMVQVVAKSSVDLVHGPVGQAKKNRKDLDERVKELRELLTKTPPAERWLVPGGREYPVKNGQVAEAPGGRERIAGAPAGR